MFGVPSTAFGTGTRDADREAIPLWPDMATPFALFCDVPWNWLSLGLSGYVRTNISRTELEACARLLGVVMTPAMFQDIRTLESEAISYWSSKR